MSPNRNSCKRSKSLGKRNVKKKGHGPKDKAKEKTKEKTAAPLKNDQKLEEVEDKAPHPPQDSTASERQVRTQLHNPVLDKIQTVYNQPDNESSKISVLQKWLEHYLSLIENNAIYLEESCLTITRLGDILLISKLKDELKNKNNSAYDELTQTIEAVHFSQVLAFFYLLNPRLFKLEDRENPDIVGKFRSLYGNEPLYLAFQRDTKNDDKDFCFTLWKHFDLEPLFHASKDIMPSDANTDVEKHLIQHGSSRIQSELIASIVYTVTNKIASEHSQNITALEKIQKTFDTKSKKTRSDQISSAIISLLLFKAMTPDTRSYSASTRHVTSERLFDITWHLHHYLSDVTCLGNDLFTAYKANERVFLSCITAKLGDFVSILSFLSAQKPGPSQTTLSVDFKLKHLPFLKNLIAQLSSIFSKLNKVYPTINEYIKNKNQDKNVNVEKGIRYLYDLHAADEHKSLISGIESIIPKYIKISITLTKLKQTIAKRSVENIQTLTQQLQSERNEKDFPAHPYLKKVKEKKGRESNFYKSLTSSNASQTEPEPESEKLIHIPVSLDSYNDVTQYYASGEVIKAGAALDISINLLSAAYTNPDNFDKSNFSELAKLLSDFYMLKSTITLMSAYAFLKKTRFFAKLKDISDIAQIAPLTDMIHAIEQHLHKVDEISHCQYIQTKDWYAYAKPELAHCRQALIDLLRELKRNLSHHIRAAYTKRDMLAFWKGLEINEIVLHCSNLEEGKQILSEKYPSVDHKKIIKDGASFFKQISSKTGRVSIEEVARKNLDVLKQRIKQTISLLDDNSVTENENKNKSTASHGTLKC